MENAVKLVKAVAPQKILKENIDPIIVNQRSLSAVTVNDNIEKKVTKEISVVDDVEEVIIKRKNQKDLVLISLEEYNSLVETNYLLSGKNRDKLLASIREAKDGNMEYQELIEE